jgi:hypothetical protein
MSSFRNTRHIVHQCTKDLAGCVECQFYSLGTRLCWRIKAIICSSSGNVLEKKYGHKLNCRHETRNQVHRQVCFHTSENSPPEIPRGFAVVSWMLPNASKEAMNIAR